MLIDHGTGIVVGETAVIGDNVSLLQEVTLGGTGRQHGDRHPKVRSGVLIGAGANVLGNIEIGANATIRAGSVVLADVPPGVTVAGVPAKIVGRCVSATPALEMNHVLPAETSSRGPDGRVERHAALPRVRARRSVGPTVALPRKRSRQRIDS